MIILIIGGVAGGATAAARLRRLDENAEIIIVERTGYISYANCGLPYYIGDEIKDQNALTLQTPESFYRRFRIDVRVHQEARTIDAKNKTVTILDLETNETYVETYDMLLLSPGAKPLRPGFPGIENDRIFTLRNVEDTLKIKDYITKENPQSVVIAGGGYIGLEMAENLKKSGMDVTIVQMMDQLLLMLDFDMAAHVHSYLKKQGINLCLNTAVTGFEKSNNKIKTTVNRGNPIDADMVILAIGVQPDTAFAKEAGIALNERGAIIVNEHMETSLQDIYAVGDAVEIPNMITGNMDSFFLAGPANRQGRIAADNICGIDSTYAGSTGASIVKLFDMTVASVGLNEKAAKETGIAYDKVILKPASHATYYPGAKILTVKVLFELETARILGAQIIGFEGVDKRIDVFATAIHAKMTAYDLTKIDLAYAPPYSSAKDPVNMAGYMIENILTGKVKQFYWDDISSLPKDGSAVLLDVRTEREYKRGNIPGFINIPVDELREHLHEIDKNRTVYVICQTGLRSYIACRILSQNGYRCYNLAGGYGFWHVITKEHDLIKDAPYPCGVKQM
jgi:NADPH-dependent 2,4-dienoyl-CoA reductase/sulfur reductase-like enzyme/rhodanese-related sulfurtransferase